MEYIDFKIPDSKSKYLDESSDSFIVREVVTKKDILTKLRNAKVAMREQGGEGIIDTFSVYDSVLHLGKTLYLHREKTLYLHIIRKAYVDLHEAFVEFDRDLDVLLDDKDSVNDEVQLKFVNILKMFTYIYTRIVVLNEEIHREMKKYKPRRRSLREGMFVVDKEEVIVTLMSVVEKKINLLWNPPVVEDNFVGLISEVCYEFLQDPAIKSEKAILEAIFDLIGVLIKNYAHGTSFVTCLVNLVKNYEHLVHCIPEGINQLIKDFNCEGLVHELMKELMEWQVDEEDQESQGGRNCSSILLSVVALMPSSMVPGLTYLCDYLSYQSPTLRNSILNLMVEIVINTSRLSPRHERTKELNKTCNNFVSKLSEHTLDNSATIRSEMLQHWVRLQNIAAIPQKIQSVVLKDVIECLRDKETVIRKNAMTCLMTFLTHNPFGENLSLSVMSEELQIKRQKLATKKEVFRVARVIYLEHMEAMWDSKKETLMAVIKEELEKEGSEERTIAGEDIPQVQMTDVIRVYLNENKFKEAFELCKIADKQIEELNALREQNKGKNRISGSAGEDNEVQLYLEVLYSVFLDLENFNEELRTRSSNDNFHMTSDYIIRKELEDRVDLLENGVEFLTQMETAFDPMMEILHMYIGEMERVVQFFVSAYRSNIDSASVGIKAMLSFMKFNGPKCRDYIMDTFKSIYLATDTSNTGEGCTLIVNRLIGLVKTEWVDNLDDLQLIIAEWTAKGLINDDIIDMLWQYFTKKTPVTDEDARAAVTILRMCAVGRKTIISGSIELVASIAFGERGENDMLLVESACELLAVAAGQTNVDERPPIKIKHNDHMFFTLLDLLNKKFFEPVEFYDRALFGALTFIYKMCCEPGWLCETFLNMVSKEIKSISQQEDYKGPEKYVITRTCQLLGFLLVKHLEYIEETVRDEANKWLDAKEEEKKQAKKTLEDKGTPAETTSPMKDEECIPEEGMQSDDIDEKFIGDILEKDLLFSTGVLEELFLIVRTVCERPKLYDDDKMQSAAVLAVMRYMLASRRVCAHNRDLVFDILEESEYCNAKCVILAHVPDLFARFPNLIDSRLWSICSSVQDPAIDVRRAVFSTFSRLILSNAIRPHGYLDCMAPFLLDEDKDLMRTYKSFLINVLNKEDDLYCLLPGVLRNVMETKDVTDETVRHIILYVFELMKVKHIEKLVKPICYEFGSSKEVRHNRHAAYCLTLIHYNEKALRELIENFHRYKRLLDDPEIYDSFKSITQSCNKINLTDVSSILERLIDERSVLHEITESYLIEQGGNRDEKRENKEEVRNLLLKFLERTFPSLGRRRDNDSSFRLS